MTDKDVSRVDVIVEGVRLPSGATTTRGERPDELWAGIITTD